jgi:SHS2 domain-containing protein
MNVMRREHTFEMIEHTADVGVAGCGKTKAEAFESTAYGMFSIVADLDKYKPTGEVEVHAEGDDDLALLQGFLSSLIVLMDGDNLLPLDFEITELQDGSVTCKVAVRTISGDIEWLGPAIKAVTYHEMKIERQDDTWKAQAIFDV